jgi:hypothetical protein
MKEVKIFELAKMELRLVNESNQPLKLTLNGEPVSLEDATDLVNWLEKEVLKRDSDKLTIQLSERLLMERPIQPSSTVQQFPALETRVANHDLTTKVVSGESQPVSDIDNRRVDEGQRGRYKQVTGPDNVNTSGLEIRGGFIENPLTVKL